jgi:hypothetical protein
VAHEWRLFWVGDESNPAGGRPVPGWEKLEERERALGLRERQPILVSPDGRVDPRLSECLRRSAFSAKARGTQVTYAPLYRLFFTFLWQRGLHWDEASEDDVEDWEDWRRRGSMIPAPVDGGTWVKEQAALKLLYGIAAQRGLVPTNPVTLTSPSDVKTSDVKWLSPRAFRLWRNVRLGGMLPGGLEDEARPVGRPAGTRPRPDVLQRPAAPRGRHPAALRATGARTLNDRLKRIDKQIRDTFRSHPQAEIIESLRPQVTLRPTRMSATSRPRPGSCPSHVTPAAGPATCTGPSATAAACDACSTCPLRPASSATGRTGTSV